MGSHCIFKRRKKTIFKKVKESILEEIELHLEDVHAKYDGIISKALVIKYQANMIEDSIVTENKIDEMHV